MKRFSSRTMSILVDVLSMSLTDAELQNFVTRFDLLKIYRREPGRVSKLRRLQDVVAYLNRDIRTYSTEEIWNSFIIEGVKVLSDVLQTDSIEWKQLNDQLKRNGYLIDENGQILKAVTEVIEEEPVGQLEKTLKEIGWEIPHRHLKQAKANYSEGQWEAANASTRSFLEGFFDHLAEILPEYPEGGLKHGGERRKFLQENGVMNKDESDLIKSFFKILHTSGSHPGLSNETDCITRLLIAACIAYRYIPLLIQEGE